MKRPNKITPRKYPRGSKARRKKLQAAIRDKLLVGMINGPDGKWHNPDLGRQGEEYIAIQNKLASNSGRNIRSRSNRGKFQSNIKPHA